MLREIASITNQLFGVSGSLVFKVRMSKYLKMFSSTGVFANSFIKNMTIILICFYYYGTLVLAEKFPEEKLAEKSDITATTMVYQDSEPTIVKTSNLGFLHAFVAALSVIVVSELGDKTFFIAAIMAMRHPRLIVFGGAISALAAMTVLSVLFGYAATIIPRAYTYYISTALFALFGLKMLRDGYYMSATEGQEELEEVQSDLRKREDEFEKEAITTTAQDPEAGVAKKTSKVNPWMFLSRIFLQAFTLTFLAEWGDRSQLTTIILAAREDVYGVIVGGVLGHSFCTGLAVLGGRMIAQRISVRTVTIIGGLVFLLFALTALFIDPTEST